MKKIFTLAATLIMTAGIWAQTPEKMSYQAVVRDASNNLLVNQAVGMKISILKSLPSGPSVYTETQTPTTNANGLVSLEIGTGTIVSGDFAIIDWANNTYYIKTETDPAGGTVYSISGTSQLMSVPYALYAKQSGSSTPGPQGPAGNDGVDGVDGTQGPQGPQGLPGTNGADGATGSQGPAGNDGVDGVDGTQGPQGPQGLPGANGADGATGPQGPAGNDGADGVDGTDGHAPDGTAPGEMLYWNGTAWVDVAPGQEGDILKFVGGKPMWKPSTNVTGSFMFNGLEYGEVTSITGEIWLDRNLGATQVDGSSSYGDLYQWGRGKDGHQIRTSGTTSTLSASDTPGHGDFITVTPSNDWRSPRNDNLWQGVSGVNNPCPSGFRLPTETEFNVERQSWGNNNATGALISPLKLIMAGIRTASGGITSIGSSGCYWSSTVNGTLASYLYFHNNTTNVISTDRAPGLSVRCIKD